LLGKVAEERQAAEVVQQDPLLVDVVHPLLERRVLLQLVEDVAEHLQDVDVAAGHGGGAARRAVQAAHLAEQGAVAHLRLARLVIAPGGGVDGDVARRGGGGGGAEEPLLQAAEPAAPPGGGAPRYRQVDVGGGGGGPARRRLEPGDL